MRSVYLEDGVERKVCTACGQGLPLSSFSKDSRSSSGVAWCCKSCGSKRAHDWQKKNKGKFNTRRKNSFYGIDFNALWESQSGLCAVCGEAMLPTGREPKSVVVDHNRRCCPSNGSCGVCVRGLVHNRCNLIIGHLESPEFMIIFKSAEEYLLKQKAGMQ